MPTCRTQAGHSSNQQQQIQQLTGNHMSNSPGVHTTNYQGSLPSSSTSLFVSTTTPPRIAAALPEMNLTASMRWPSVRRSVSSTTATRESSRHSEAVDPRSSRGIRPMSSSMDSHTAQSSHRTIPQRGASSERVRTTAVHSHKPHAVGSRASESAMTPPLIAGLFDQDRSLTVQSLPTTTVCTPREDPLLMQPPLEQYEMEAEAMSIKELRQAVEDLQTGNRVSKTGIIRAQDSYASLREGMNETYMLVEQRQENITNGIMRKLDAVKRQKANLARDLSAVESQKSLEEARLQKMQSTIATLSQHLTQEEKAIESRMRQQLLQLKSQRQQLEELLQDRPSSLQQLEELVDEAQKLACDYTTTIFHHPLLHAEEVLSQSSPIPEPEMTSWNDELGVDQTPRGAARQTSDDGTEHIVLESTHNPNERLHYLEREIAVVEGLRKEDIEAVDQYASTAKQLEQRVQAEQHKRRQQLDNIPNAQGQPETEKAFKEFKGIRNIMGVDPELRFNSQNRPDDSFTPYTTSSNNDSFLEVTSNRVSLQGPYALGDTSSSSKVSKAGVSTTIPVASPIPNWRQAMSPPVQVPSINNSVDALLASSANKSIPDSSLLANKTLDSEVNATANLSYVTLDPHTNQYIIAPYMGSVKECSTQTASTTSINFDAALEMNMNQCMSEDVTGDTVASSVMQPAVGKKDSRTHEGIAFEETLNIPAGQQANMIHTPSICVQNTARMSPPRPLILEATPQKYSQKCPSDDSMPPPMELN